MIITLLFAIAIKTGAQADTNFFQSRNNFYQGSFGIIDTNEAGLINQFKKYEYFQGPKFSPSGNFKEAFTQYKNWISDYTLNGETTSTLISDWESIGPHNTPAAGISSMDFTRGVGRLICISLDPDNFQDTIYTGSPFGGAWKTYDAGQNWTNLSTDFLPVTKCSDIAINPNSTNMIFMATGDRDDYHNASISAGVYRSIDAGTTWAAVNSGLNFDDFYQISKILINPSDPDITYLATSRGIYKTTNATTNCQWVQLTDPLVYQKYFRNIIFKPDGLYSTIYASGKDIITSSNGGASWASMTGTGTGLNFPSFTEYPNPIRINITVSEDAPNKIFAYISLSDETGQINTNSKVKVIVGIFDGNLWSIKDFLPDNKKPYPTFDYTLHAAGPAWMPIAVSPVNADHIYIGNAISWRTFDGGENWEPTFAYYGGLIHPDCHDLKYSPDGQKLYLATDGGFYKITNPASTSSPSVVELNNGLTIGTITKIALTNQNEKFTLMGEIDCGSNKYDPSNLSPNPWKIIRDGDGTEQEINLNHMDTIYASTPKNNITFHNDRGESGYGSSLGSPANENSIFIPDYTLSPANQNVIYANFTDLYKMQHPGSWVRLSDLEADFSLYSGDPLTALDIAPNNQDYIYIAVEAYQVNAPSEYLLFKTTTGGYDNGCTTGCWTEMFPPNPNYITSIAVSPYNESEIWISHSGYIQNNKVKYFDGNTWFDFSSGLPNLPVNDIIFNYGSDNGIFAAMDNGVYYRDATMNQWESFKENLPNVSVSELEINYGFSKITAGTFGRGLWESSLSCTISDSVFRLSNNQHWNVPMRFDRNVIVSAGTTLTIGGNATLYFVPGAKIIVEQGGKLVIDGGLLTSACDSLWQGVEVWGNPALSQIPANQGWLSISNGGTIQNAVVAVKAGSGDFGAKGGGIVHASEAFFRNNQSDVAFHDYARNNLSNFSQTTFETTSALLSGATPAAHLSMVNVRGIQISGCTFQNTSSSGLPVNKQGTGIHSYNSSYYVDHFCISQNNPCSEYLATTFENLYYGVRAYGLSAELKPSIQNSIFTNNYRGAWLGGTTYAVVKNCLFDINTPWVTEGGYGLYLDNSTAYKIEENNFYSSMTSRTGIGVIVHNSGSDPNEVVYRNWFTGLQQGIAAQEQNRNITSEPEVGLQILCCEFNDCDYDILIPAPANKYWGIAESQGANNQNPEDMAGNLFDIHGQIPDGDFDDINNQGAHITYYYPINNNDSRVKPIDYTKKTVTTISKQVIPEWNFEEGCPPASSGGGTTEAELRSGLNELNTTIENMQQSLMLLTDGGNTETLYQEVETSLPPETLEVYNALMDQSPNLSDTVAGAAIGKENVLPGAMLRDVLVANPQTAKSDKLMDKLDERMEPLPDYMKAQILEGRNITSLKEEMESQLAKYRLTKSRTFNSLMHYYQHPDSINDGADSIVQLLINDTELSAKYQLALIYLQKGNLTQCEATLDDILLQYSLQGAELVSHQDMVSFCDLAANILASENGWYSATTAQLQQLAAVQQATAPAATYARNVLAMLHQTEYDEPIQIPDLFKSTKAEEEYGLIRSAKVPSALEVYPNPAKDYLMIKYTADQQPIIGTLEIRNLKGELIRELPITKAENTATVITRGWNAGTYIVSLVADGKISESTKFTIIQ
jgi:photosystem II stability/assembly factor-like uncharacterized protein